ncbi:MAG TPA: CvpA family protein [Phycisphaerae bacterium]|nr:CvpA family protein [Phycisphaerae bacterium]
MILQLIVLLIIVLITLFMANEGPLSALLLLAAALIGSLTAMGAYEAASAQLMGWRPDYALGLSFLLIFIIVFCGIRLLFDFLVRGDLEIPLWPSRIVGGVIGFFVALVTIGTVLIGIQMMPLPSSILFFDRYGSSDGMAGAESSIVFWPDEFTEGIWDLVSGGSFAGPTQFKSVHPDFLTELYGDRYTVEYSDEHSLPQNLLKVLAVYTVPSDELGTLGIHSAIQSSSPQKYVVVQTEVQHGESPPDVSSYDGTYFRITPGEVRLVTDADNQYFPIGYIVQGIKFKSLKMTDPMVDDYQPFDNNSVVVHNWVFHLNSDETPTYIQVKGTALVDLMNTPVSKKLAVIPAAAYPQRPYNNSTINVTLAITNPGGTLHLLILRQATQHQNVVQPLQDAFDQLDTMCTQIANANGPWYLASQNVGTNPDKSQAVPNAFTATSERTIANNMANEPNTDMLSWNDLIHILLTAQVGHNTTESLTKLSTYMDQTLVPLMQGDVIASSQLSDTGALAAPINIAPGDYTVVVWWDSALGMQLWVQDTTVQEDAQDVVSLDASGLFVNYRLK